jgi:hypothetical protein
MEDVVDKNCDMGEHHHQQQQHRQTNHDNDDESDSGNSYMDSLFVSEHMDDDGSSSWTLLASPITMMNQEVFTATTANTWSAAPEAPQLWPSQHQQQRQQELMRQQMVLMMQTSRAVTGGPTSSEVTAAAAATAATATTISTYPTRGARSSSMLQQPQPQHQLHHPVMVAHHPRGKTIMIPTTTATATRTTSSSSSHPLPPPPPPPPMVCLPALSTITSANSGGSCHGNDDDEPFMVINPTTLTTQLNRQSSDHSNGSSGHNTTSHEFVLAGATPLARLYAMADNNYNGTDIVDPPNEFSWQQQRRNGIDTSACAGPARSSSVGVKRMADHPTVPLHGQKKRATTATTTAMDISNVPITSMSPSLVIVTLGLPHVAHHQAARRTSPSPSPSPPLPQQHPQRVWEWLWQEAAQAQQQQLGGPPPPQLFLLPPRVKANEAKYDTVPTPLQLASYGTAVIAAVHRHDVTTLAALFRAGLSRNPCNQFRDSLLDYACQNAKASVVQCFVENGAALSVCDAFGRTPLHYCARSHVFSESIVSTILQADPQQLYQEDKEGKTPLEMVSPTAAADWVDFIRRYMLSQREQRKMLPLCSSSSSSMTTTTIHCLEHRMQLADPPRSLSVPAARALAATGLPPQAALVAHPLDSAGNAGM